MTLLFLSSYVALNQYQQFTETEPVLLRFSLVYYPGEQIKHTALSLARVERPYLNSRHSGAANLTA